MLLLAMVCFALEILLAYQIIGDFWIDGIVSTSRWNWSNQSILWYFTEDERAVVGNGTNYKLAYNLNTSAYQLADDSGSKTLHYICEYQSMLPDPFSSRNCPFYFY